ncbi:MAG: aminotransferase class V-fold PLP-dependent enzyme [Pirellulaceae bacterium]|nr:aminotransferase class V-fold PLP-dependent enzyme [Pirellulaceae bacterium]
MPQRIYLDNAATSWPKPQSVLDAAWDFMTSCGATAGRGSYASARRAEQWLADARRSLSKLIGASDSGSIAFCSSGTHAVNAALWGLVNSGDHVITTQIEHNSVLRPLHQLTQQLGIDVEYVHSDERGIVSLEQARSLVRSHTRWFIIGHGSNVTGAVQDLSGWSRLARDSGARLMVDGSQTLGYVAIDVQAMGIDVFASAGHKGLQALAGTGLLYVSPELQASVRPLMTGGTGLHSQSVDHRPAWPHAVEVGNHNLPGIISMAAAAQELLIQAQDSPIRWQVQWREMMQGLVSGLREIPGVKLLGFTADDWSAAPGRPIVDRLPLISMQLEGWDVHDLAAVLDSHYGIEVRAGLHCAALIHSALNSQEVGGTLRISLGHHTTSADIAAVLAAITEIATSS